MVILKGLLKILILVLLIVIARFVLWIDYNEADVIPYALATFDSDWISNDWYLNHEMLYRYPFSYVVGFFADLVGFLPIIFFGRILTYFLFAAAFLRLCKSMNLPFQLSCLSLMLYLMFFGDGINAGEWMVGGFETKSFAYPMLLYSLAYFLDRKYEKSLFFAGLLFSLHVLVGAYYAICLGLLFVYQSYRSKTNLISRIRLLPFFVASGFWGLLSVLHHLFLDKNTDAARGWLAYVKVRVPYHVLPKLQKGEVVTLLVLMAILICIRLFTRKEKVRELSLIGIYSFLFTALGFCVFQFGDHLILRYYFFRLGDALVPVTIIISLAVLIADRTNRIYVGALVLVVAAFFLSANKSGIADFTVRDNYTIEEIKRKSGFDPDLTWIKDHISPESVIVVPPEISSFYLFAKRAVFVTWKHVPQTNEFISEWFDRINMLSEDDLLVRKGDGRLVVAEEYKELKTDQFIGIKKVHEEITHVLATQELNLTVIKEFEDFTLYSLE